MSIVDCSRVVGNLLQGSFPPTGPFVARYADVLVLCARELQPHEAAYPGVRVVRAPLNDDPSKHPMTHEERVIAARAARYVRMCLDAGRRVLVTCHLGLNRSGLVSALSLMLPPGNGRTMWYRADTPSCLTSDQATALVRRARGASALGNPQFRQLLAYTDGVCGAQPRAFNPGSFL